jgi:ABC-type Mn2+/Zn2+ transport system ATPase subunit
VSPAIPPRPATDEVLVDCTSLSVQLGSTLVLDRVDLRVRRGEFVGIVGPSGSGKTTLLRAVLGTVAAGGGKVDVLPGLRVGYVPQVESVDWNFPVTVLEVMVMSRAARFGRPHTTDAERADAEEVLARLGLSGLADRHIRELSGGQQQRVFVARALYRRPDLLVLDEPTSGVDVRTRHEVLHLLGDLHADGMTILLTTHDLNGLAAHLPRIICLSGTVVADGAPLDVLDAAVLERTYGAPMEVLHHGGMPVVVDVATGPGMVPR